MNEYIRIGLLVILMITVILQVFAVFVKAYSWIQYDNKYDLKIGFIILYSMSITIPLLIWLSRSLGLI